MTAYTTALSVLPNDLGRLDAASGLGLYRRMLKPNSVPACSEREAVTSCDAVLAASRSFSSTAG
jgi:hypothetical protein